MTQFFFGILLQLTYFAAQVAIVTAAGTWLIAAWARAKVLTR